MCRRRNTCRLLWLTMHGRIVAAGAIVWMAIGTAIMKKMVAFEI